MGFLRGFSIAMGANAILFVLSLLNNKLVYVFLTPEQNGTYFLVMRSSLLVSLVFGEWLRLSNINIAGQRKGRSDTLTTNMLVYSAIVALVLLAAFRAFPRQSLFPGIPSALTGIVIAVGVGFIIRDSSQSLLLVNNRIVTYGVTTVLWGGAMLCLIALFVIGLGMDFNGVIAALVISTVLAAAWALTGCFRGFGFSFRPSPQLFGESVKMGIRSAVAVIGMFCMLNIQTFSLQPLATSPAEGLFMVGIFSVCFRIYQLFQRISDVTGTIVFSQVAQKKETAGVLQTAAVHRNILFFFTLLVFMTVFAGKYIIYIIADEKYYGAYIPFLFMLPGIVFFNSAFVLNSSYWGRGYPLHIILSPYVISIAGLGLNYLFIPSLGVAGATISFSLMSVAWYMYLLFMFRRLSGVPLAQLLLPQRSDFRLIRDRLSLVTARFR